MAVRQNERNQRAYNRRWSTVKIKDVAKSDKEIAEDKMKKMEAQINDQLTGAASTENAESVQSAVRWEQEY